MHFIYIILFECNFNSRQLAGISVFVVKIGVFFTLLHIIIIVVVVVVWCVRDDVVSLLTVCDRRIDDTLVSSVSCPWKPQSNVNCEILSTSFRCLSTFDRLTRARRR